MTVHIDALYFVAVVVFWLVAYHLTYWLAAIAGEHSLVCLGVGPLGMTVVSLRQPAPRRIAAQLATAAGVLACIVYANLYVVTPPPIAGLKHSFSQEFVGVALPVAIATATRLLIVLRDRRYPLWGEAGVMARVQRSVATGSKMYFTSAGKTFLQERFGATPREFISMIR